MRRAFILGACLLAGCASPEASYLSRNPGTRLALELVDQSSGPAALGAEGLAAYRAALEARLGTHLRPDSTDVPRLRVIFQGTHASRKPVTDLDRSNAAALDQSPVALTFLAAGSGDAVQAKLAALGYTLRLPEATFEILLPENPAGRRSQEVPEARIILAHPKLMHGERGPEARLQAEAQAFAQALHQELQKSWGWPPAGR